MASETETYFQSQLASVVAPGEQILASAYLKPQVGGGGRVQTFIRAARDKAAFVAVTDRRLVLIQTRIPAFGPLLENQGVLTFDRAQVRGAHLGKTLWIELGDGSMLEYQRDTSTKHIAGQADFFARIEALLGKSEAAAAAAAGEARSQRTGLAVGIAVAVAYVLYRFLAS